MIGTLAIGRPGALTRRRVSFWTLDVLLTRRSTGETYTCDTLTWDVIE